MTEAVAATPVVLADGHHRFETACAYRDERVAAGIDDPGAGRIMAFAAELADDELSVRPIHRLVHGLQAVDARRALDGRVHRRRRRPEHTGGRSPSSRARMRDDGALGLVDRSGLAVLRPTRDVTDVDEVLRDVDSVRFDEHVRAALPGATVTFRSDAAAVAALVEKGAADAAVLLRPVTVAQIRAAAFAGVRMPEKTTFFSPKPRTGMVFRSLDEAGVAPT